MALAAGAAGDAPLMLDGLIVPGPDGAVGASDAADQLYKSLEVQWGWGPHVTKYLREEMECETLHDLISSFKCEADWTDFYRADIKEDGGKQVSRQKRGRVSQCHEKMVGTQTESAKIKAKGEEAVDFEKPLGTEVLRKMREAFWERHKIVIPIEKMPGDTLLSRIS